MSTDRAIRVVLIVTELVTNSAKHAYPEGQPGRVVVRLTRGDGNMPHYSSDDGGGLPPDFQLGRGGGLGMRLVMALSEQTDAVVRVSPVDVGTEFVIELPLEARQ